MPYQTLQINYPQRFWDKLSAYTSVDYKSVLGRLRNKIGEFISNGNVLQEFQKDFTNHGINHINEVLSNADFLIPTHTFNQLTAAEVFYLSASIVLHDIALHISWPVFHCMINGCYDKVIGANERLDKGISWRAAFELHLEKNGAIELLDKPKFWVPDNKDRAIIGEFIRKNHHRFGLEVSELGFYNPGMLLFEGLYGTAVRLDERRMIGIIARSHCHDLFGADLNAYLLQHFKDAEHPFGVRIKYLMAVLRIADYMAIDSERSGLNSYRYMESGRSFIEHLKHKMIRPVERSEIVNKVFEVHVWDPESIMEDYPLASEPHREAFTPMEIVREVAVLINDIQAEINSGTEIVAALNRKYHEERFGLNLEEINWKPFNYCPKHKHPANGIYKLRPYRYPGYLIDSYLQTTAKLSHNIDFYVNDDWHPVKTPDLHEIYYPLTFRKLKSAFAVNSSEPVAGAAETTPNPTISGDRAVPLTKVAKQTLSGDNDLSETTPHVEMLRDIFNPENSGTGIVSDLGFGKTILCKALLHFFRLRAVNDRRNEEVFWKDMHHLDALQYIPLLYTCRSSRRIKKYTTIKEFIADALTEVIDEDNQQFNLLVTEFSNAFHNRSHRILFIVDAIDELEDRLDGDIIREFMKFLMSNVVDNNGYHALIFTKRDGLETEHREQTLRYAIEELNDEQQRSIVFKLCGLYNIIDPDKIEEYLSVLTGDNASLQLKRNVLNLTNSFIYYHKFHKTPSIDQFEKELIRIFFARKDVLYTEEMRYFLTTIAVSIRNQKDGIYILEDELLKLAEKEFLKLNFLTARALIDLLTQRVGILKRRVEWIGEERKVIYEFNEVKQYQNLLDIKDAEGITNVNQIKPKMNELLEPEIRATLDQLPGSMKRLIINMLRYLSQPPKSHE